MRSKLLLLISLGLFAGCKNGPKVTICISDPINEGFQCSDADENKFFLPYPDSENYIALSSDDARKLFEFCRNK